MLPPASARVWLAAGMTDMRPRMNGLALYVPQSLQRDPRAGVDVARNRGGDLVKALWHDRLCVSSMRNGYSEGSPLTGARHCYRALSVSYGTAKSARASN